MGLEYQIMLAVLLDLLVGDPRWFPHPVRFMGRLAMALEGPSRRLVPSPRHGRDRRGRAGGLWYGRCHGNLLYGAGLLDITGLGCCLDSDRILGRGGPGHGGSQHRGVTGAP